MVNKNVNGKIDVTAELYQLRLEAILFIEQKCYKIYM
jgi:hypothetical protein